MVRFGRTPLNAPNPRNPDPNLSGWAGIEHEMTTHDDPMMSDYADDIDTMLVFAALFSAVVTTFAAQTYQSLQADSMTTTNQLIAYQISLQGTQPNVPPAIDSTITNLLSPQPSQTSTSARWINALFFLSLVLSLAAALMGIMAKQWIREYLKWNMPLAQPRENVLVRQIRIEAWEKWRVEGIFWSIPILLELAMVLFLAGVSALLWTLDDIIARTITIFVAIFLGLFAVITILPVFIKRCPYKSPTSWVLLRLYALIRDSCVSLLKKLSWRIYGDLSSTYTVNHWKYWSRTLSNDLATLNSWRDWDLDSCRVASWYGRSWPWYSDAATGYALAQLNGEACELPPDPGAPQRAVERSFQKLLELSYIIRDVRETSVLLRALSWVAQASQEQRVRQYIDESMISIHTPVSSYEPGILLDTVQLRTVTDWCILGALFNGELQNPHLLLTAPANADQQSELRSISQIRDTIGVQVERSPDGQQLYWGLWNMEGGPLTDCPLPGLEFEFSFRSVQLLLAVDLMHATTLEENSPVVFGTPEHQPTSGVHPWWHSVSRLRRVAELVSAMFQMRLANIDQDIGAGAYLAGLRVIVSVPDSQFDITAPGLRSLAYKVAFMFAYFPGSTVDEDTFPLDPDASDDELFTRFGTQTHIAEPSIARPILESTSRTESNPRLASPPSNPVLPRAHQDIFSLTVQLDHTAAAPCPVTPPSPSRRQAILDDPSQPEQHVFASNVSLPSDWVETPRFIVTLRSNHNSAHHEELSILPEHAPLSDAPPAEPQVTHHQHEDSYTESVPIERSLTRRGRVTLDEDLHLFVQTIPSVRNGPDDELELAERGVHPGITTGSSGIQPLPEDSLVTLGSDPALTNTQSISEVGRTAQVQPFVTHTFASEATADPQSPSPPGDSPPTLEHPSSPPLYASTSDASPVEPRVTDRPSDHDPGTLAHPFESSDEAADAQTSTVRESQDGDEDSDEPGAETSNPGST